MLVTHIRVICSQLLYLNFHNKGNHILALEAQRHKVQKGASEILIIEDIS